jgi:hypothetical protein
MGKQAGFIKLYNDTIKKEAFLSDQEWRLYLVLLRLRGWDRKYEKSYKKVRLTIRELKNEYLPNWAIGKIDLYITNLIQKGFIKKLGRSNFLVSDLYEIDNNRVIVHVAEQNKDEINPNYVQSKDEKVQTPEQNLQETERIIPSKGLEYLRKNLEIRGIIKEDFHVNEQKNCVKII